MIVTFHSSETGEVLMFAEVAAKLLKIVGKECTARGVFTQPQMMPAVEALRKAISGEVEPEEAEDETPEEAELRKKHISLRQRAWPLMDMLERTSKTGQEANVLWEAAKDF